MAADGRRLDRRARGDVAERAARDALLRAGLQAVAANASYRGGELDLVMIDPAAREGRTLVFVEVRYRGRDDFGGGAASIGHAKRRRLVLAAELFLSGHRQFADWPCRFDVVQASGDPDAPEIEWIRDAFRPGE